MATEEQLRELEAAMNNHQVTDDNGDLIDEEIDTSQDESATSEENVSDDVSDDGDDNTVVDDSVDYPVDDEDTEIQRTDAKSGKSVPVERFNSVYGKLKAAERELEARSKGSVDVPKITPHASKADVLESEMLMDKYPEFDPSSDRYDQVLDAMAFDIFEANGGSFGNITRLQAARKALDRAKKLGVARMAVKSQARAVKVAQAGGSVGKTSRHVDTTPKVSDMSLEEKEKVLRDQGLWDTF